MLLSGFICNTNNFICPLILIPFHAYAIVLSQPLPCIRLISSSAIPWFEAEGKDMPLLPSAPSSPDQISSASWPFPLCRPFPTEGDNETPDHPSPYLCFSVAPFRQSAGPGDVNPHRMINLLLLPSCAIPDERFFILRSILEHRKAPSSLRSPLHCYSLCHPLMVTLCFR